MAKAPLAVKRKATLSAYEPSLREKAAILGERGFKAVTGREPGYEARENINRYTGLLDLLEVPGAVLSANDAVRNIKSKQYGAAAGDIAGLAAGAIPIAGGALKKGAKKVVEEGVEGAERLVEKYIPETINRAGDFSFENGNIIRGNENLGTIKLRMETSPKPHVVVDDISIKGSLQRQGIGSSVLNSLRDEVGNKGLGLALTSDAMRGTAAQAGQRKLYDRLGFSRNKGETKIKGLQPEFYSFPKEAPPPENLATKYDLPPVITGAEREANLARFMEGSQAPRDLYHGTGADISEFKKSNTGEFGPGLYMTTSPSEAEMYANISNTSANIMPVYANIKNPFFVEKSPSEFWNTFGGGTDEEATQRAIAAGYDGVVFKRPVEVWSDKLKKTIPTGEMQSHVIAFHPETQIKSKYNIGTFDPTTPHIGKAHGGPVSLKDKYGC